MIEEPGQVSGFFFRGLRANEGVCRNPSATERGVGVAFVVQPFGDAFSTAARHFPRVIAPA